MMQPEDAEDNIQVGEEKDVQDVEEQEAEPEPGEYKKLALNRSSVTRCLKCYVLPELS